MAQPPVASAARPSHGPLRRVLQAWTRFGRRLADVQARLLLTVFYFVVLAPFALAIRAFFDPLALRSGWGPAWRTRSARPGNAVERASQQY